MADDRHDDRPEYTVYRSRPRLLRRREDGKGGDGDARAAEGLAGLQELRGPDHAPAKRRRRLRVSPARLLKWLAVAVAAWVLLSLIVFLVSAQIQSAKIDDSVKAKLTGAGFPLTSPNTILVLGSDARPKGSKEPGATIVGEGPSRSDSILLMRIGGGKNATLSVLRDTVVDIPGHGRGKVNAAYAFGGPALALETIEQYLGIEVNHLVEVNFENFPALIDSLGGIDYRGSCVISKINGGRENGGYTLRLRRGEHEINGRQALALARTRKNLCNPREDDRARVVRQQKILTAIRDKVISFETFLRLPLVSWRAPQAVRSDMAGPSLLGLVGAELIGGDGKRAVLRPSGVTTLPGGESAVEVDEATRRRAVETFLEG